MAELCKESKTCLALIWRRPSSSTLRRTSQDGLCKRKAQLIKGKRVDGKEPEPGADYTAASRGKGPIRDWFTSQYKSAGVAIRLDGHNNTPWFLW